MGAIPIWFQRVLQMLGYVVLAILCIWSVAALCFFDVLPAPLPRILAVVWATVLLVLFFGWRIFGLRPLVAKHCPWMPGWFTIGVPHTVAIVVALAGYGTMFMAWKLKTPSAERTWLPEHARDIQVRYGNDGVVEIDNIRNAIYRSATDFDVHWETRAYQLGEIDSLDVIIEPFMEWQGISHFILSFGFESGEHVAISVEARVEADEDFGVVPALFKEYELIYVVGDERDLLHRRVNMQDHNVFLFPVAVNDREQLRALFVLVLNHARALANRPQFYNTLLNNCTNAQMRHIEYLAATRFPWLDYRLILPGYIDKFLHDAGAIDNTVPLAELRERCLINERAAPPGDLSSSAWSAQIRAGVPGH